MNLHRCSDYKVQEGNNAVYRSQTLCHGRNYYQCIFKYNGKKNMQYQYILDKVYGINEL